mmetsp:Transcript_6013/g.13953  ORF Transcript_6013/g.13953 Transcript_6013/m.13953 type:complete len:115 (+) Transcript_6013:37-381(+)
MHLALAPILEQGAKLSHPLTGRPVISLTAKQHVNMFHCTTKPEPQAAAGGEPDKTSFHIRLASRAAFRKWLSNKLHNYQHQQGWRCKKASSRSVYSAAMGGSHGCRLTIKKCNQ